jgi:hypothetical protein
MLMCGQGGCETDRKRRNDRDRQRDGVKVGERAKKMRKQSTESACLRIA